MWNHICLAFESVSKKITVVINGKTVSNEIDEHLHDIDVLVPMKSIFIMGGFHKHLQKHVNSLFGKMTDLQVEPHKVDSEFIKYV